MNDRTYYEIYNVITKESAVLPIDKGVDKAIISRLFQEQYGKDGWVVVGPLQLEGGEE